MADIDAGRGEAAAAAIAAEGGKAAFVACNVADESQLEAAVSEAVERFGGLHCAFNNAGVEQVSAPIAEMNLAE